MHRHLGLIAEVVLTERAAIREVVASAMATPDTEPESGDVTRIIERMRAGESPMAIAREAEALGPAQDARAASCEPAEGRPVDNQLRSQPAVRPAAGVVHDGPGRGAGRTAWGHQGITVK